MRSAKPADGFRPTEARRDASQTARRPHVSAVTRTRTTWPTYPAIAPPTQQDQRPGPKHDSAPHSHVDRATLRLNRGRRSIWSTRQHSRVHHTNIHTEAIGLSCRACVSGCGWHTSVMVAVCSIERHILGALHPGRRDGITNVRVTSVHLTRPRLLRPLPAHSQLPCA